MEIFPLTLNCRLETTAILPEFKGSALRGALGRALKRVSCALKRKECAKCLLAESCIYANFFEVMPGRRVHHPFVLEPPDDTKREYRAGDVFSFNILLFGKSVTLLPHIIYSVIRMGEWGIGKGIKNGLGRFKLISSTIGNETIFDSESGKIRLTERPLELRLDAYQETEEIHHLHINLLTPLRIKYENNFTDVPDFHVLVRAALRRISSLETAFGAGEPDLNYPGLIKRAAQVKMTDMEVKWTDITRFSSRQRTKMKIGGITGIASYEGDLKDFIPLFKYCEVVHLGKQTSFGLGKVRVS